MDSTIATMSLSTLPAVCSSGVYSSFLAWSTEPAALSYCSANFPLPVVTTTMTATSTVQNTVTEAARIQNAVRQFGGGRRGRWSSILQQRAGIISTACSCIETPKIVTVCSSFSISLTLGKLTPLSDNGPANDYNHD